MTQVISALVANKLSLKKSSFFYILNLWKLATIDSDNSLSKLACTLCLSTMLEIIHYKNL